MFFKNRSVRARRACLYTFLAAAGGLAMTPAQAQTVLQRSFQNLSFESPDLQTAGCRVYIPASQVPGWDTTHPSQATENVGGCVVPSGFDQTAPIIELWRTPRNNGSGGTVDARSGLQVAELNAALASRIFQSVCLVSGDDVRWRFSHRGRGSATTTDKANMVVGSSTIVTVGTTNDGTHDTPVATLGTVNTPVNAPGNATWVDYSGDFRYAGATGVQSFGFEAVGGTTSGNLLDDIQIELAPFVEFVQPTSTTPESSTENVPTLRVNGTVDSVLTITVRVTGGTATLGTDYTVNGGTSNVMTVTVQPGTYDGISNASLFPLPIAIVDDTVAEADETILLAIDAPSGSPAPFMLKSNTTCGGDGLSERTYTIVDDEPRAAVSVSKTNGTTTSSAGSATAYAIVVTNGGPSAANGALVRDPAVPGLTCTTASCGGETGNATCPTQTGAQLLGLLQSAGGVAIPVLPNAGSVTFTVNCTFD